MTPISIESALHAHGDRVEAGDWDLLFRAVQTRLRQAADSMADRLPIQDCLVECLDAFEQLRATALREWHRPAPTPGSTSLERHAALHDSLTSLPNRGFFRTLLDHALAHIQAERSALAVLYLDLDGFRAINQAHGQAIGDELLKLVGARISRAVRAGDMVSRLGDDDFACLPADPMDAAQLSRLARKLFDAVSVPFRIGTLEITVRPSIGIAISPAHGATTQVLLERAEDAMYRAKESKSGFAFFD
ncbi:MAG: GGDEF domain-containing protein [Aquabacterium sp.]|uniref:GGDEF domain-containing protein n=1 Tax=Aquabacterium sp. TaxID=1872578 RepID=UPI0027201D49|nr:GGDEF domain-containing protein [Aquabacterium sp.]MDO9004287.1 GGDEF domain-containing protein [Aquabacterium sp.]